MLTEESLHKRRERGDRHGKVPPSQLVLQWKEDHPNPIHTMVLHFITDKFIVVESMWFVWVCSLTYCNVCRLQYVQNVILKAMNAAETWEQG